MTRPCSLPLLTLLATLGLSACSDGDEEPTHTGTNIESEGSSETGTDSNLQSETESSTETETESSIETETDPGDPDAWTQIALGTYHTCGIRGDRSMWCFGDGRQGQRGDASDDTVRTTPQRVLAAGEGLDGDYWTDWTAVSAGGFTTCGLRRNGTLWCWGDGSSGERGDGTLTEIGLTPSAVAADRPEAAPWSDWIAVSVGSTHACGIREGGTLWCWGFAASGRLGHGDDEGDLPNPVQVVQADAEEGGPTWSDWIAVSAGGRSVCGLREDGSLWCWGESGFGQRGDGITGFESRSTPSRVLTADGEGSWSDWIAVSSGAHHVCGLRSNGSDESTAWCWGRSQFGQRGDDSWSLTRALPAAVLQAEGGEDPEVEEIWTDWVALAANGALSCGLRSNGTLWCWGQGANGERGDGLPFDSQATPAAVLAEDGSWGEPGWTDWTDVAVGEFHACGIREDASLWCWGDGFYGQRGDSQTTRERLTPIRVVDP